MTSENEKETDQAPFGDNPAESNEMPADNTESAEPQEDSKKAAEEGTEESSDESQPEEAAEETSIESLEAEVADLKDKLLRAMAETENVRRRAERDKEDANKYAIASFAREMVEVRDNLRRALDAIESDAAKDNESITGLIEGIEMTERTLLSTFERFEIKPIEAMHQKFDHNFHEALFEIEDASVPSGTVVQEVQAGYKIHDRLLRPAKVGVSKGGAKVAAELDGAEETSEGATGEAAGEQTVKKSAQAYESSDSGSGGKIDEEL